MQKWTALLFAALVLGTIGVVVYPALRGAPSTPAPATDAGAPSPAPADAGATAVTDAGTAEPTDAEAPVEPTLGEGDPTTTTTDAGGLFLPNGEPPPAIAAEAPKSVVFGVILVQYKGAQGAPTNARSREEALGLAKQLAEEAKTDFKAAVAKGDKGSMENAGRLPRGMLEPAPEYVLFSLPKGGVSDPVDTPRGYWIIQRIE
ncbi:peptidylprolyl isomerase [Polyangium aurulentum]|uniref:peptidylprolyl isomerase n=1 Tax=Polyangium aurulentum TaxID=2567896 RepID=UPI0010ADA969|nr:peptidylprolyl isomerase [Polyangium aurulentum]UQA62778.1 peptidyl-prolyl cis-trans isomerase [Polyangium aurulentum]